MIADPIRYFLNKFSFEPDEIREISVGKKYVACELNNQDLGVCATLGQVFPANYSFRKSMNPDDICDRIVLNAWMNARLNPHVQISSYGDIFDQVDFNQRQKIGMVGYFAPLIKKFDEARIPLHIFDLHEQSRTTPLIDLNRHLADSDWIILTSTSISNKSYVRILEGIGTKTGVLLLGPSGILHADLLRQPGIQGIYGMLFRQNQKKVIELIKQGHGTREFGKFGTKVVLTHEI